MSSWHVIVQNMINWQICSIHLQDILESGLHSRKKNFFLPLYSQHLKNGQLQWLLNCLPSRTMPQLLVSVFLTSFWFRLSYFHLKMSASYGMWIQERVYQITRIANAQCKTSQYAQDDWNSHTVVIIAIGGSGLLLAALALGEGGHGFEEV